MISSSFDSVDDYHDTSEIACEDGVGLAFTYCENYINFWKKVNLPFT